MSKFYGSVQGQRGRATRCGHESMHVVAASWEGAVYVTMSEKNGCIWVDVRTHPWHGHGEHQHIYNGPLNATILPAGIRTELLIHPKPE